MNVCKCIYSLFLCASSFGLCLAGPSSSLSWGGWETVHLVTLSSTSDSLSVTHCKYSQCLSKSDVHHLDTFLIAWLI